MWVETSVCRLFADNVGLFANNVGRDTPLFANNVSRKMLWKAGRSVLGKQVATDRQNKDL
jgi:hypothetical protein